MKQADEVVVTMYKRGRANSVGAHIRRIARATGRLTATQRRSTEGVYTEITDGTSICYVSVGGSLDIHHEDAYIEPIPQEAR